MKKTKENFFNALKKIICCVSGLISNRRGISSTNLVVSTAIVMSLATYQMNTLGQFVDKAKITVDNYNASMILQSVNIYNLLNDRSSGSIRDIRDEQIVDAIKKNLGQIPKPQAEGKAFWLVFKNSDNTRSLNGIRYDKVEVVVYDNSLINPGGAETHCINLNNN